MKKKIVIISIVSVVSVALVVGGIFSATKLMNSGKTAEVQSVSMLNWGYSSDGMISEGIVRDGASQSVRLEDQQIVEEVFVTEGQEVSVGDKLMSFDITSLLLSIEVKKLDIASLQNRYNAATNELARLKATTPMQETDIVVPTVPETPVVPDTPLNPSYLPTEEKTGEAYNIISTTSIPVLSEADKDTYLCTQGAYVNGAFLNQIKENGRTVVFEVREGNVATGELVTSFTVNGSRLTDTYSEESIWLVFFNHDLVSGAGNDVDIVVPEETLEEPEETVGYTAKELADAIAAKEFEIKQLDLDIRKAQLALSEMEEQTGDGIVYAKIDGTVKSVQDPDNLLNDGSPFMVVSGSSGIYIQGSISELDLDTVSVGQSVSGYSWESGMSYFGTIASIDNYPSDDLYYYGECNPNSSLYGYVAYIEDPTGLESGMYLELTIMPEDEMEQMDSIYIENCYVREENGQSYVFKDENGVLVKQPVVTGRSLWGSAIEIKEGLTMDDYIAFPYGKTAKEGVKTEIVDSMMYW